MDELVSIGIPSYNRPKRLRQALESIVNQSYKNLEIIISDDCSTDHEVNEICSEFASSDQRIKYIRHPRNQGPSFNFHYTLSMASGKYFMWASNDDTRHLDCVAKYLENIGTSGAVYSTYEIENYASGERKVFDVKSVSKAKPELQNVNRFLKSPCPSSIYGLYLTDILKKVMPADTFDFWDFYVPLKIMHSYGFSVFKDEPLVSFGINGRYKLNPWNGRYFKVRPYWLGVMPIILSNGPMAFIRHIRFLKTVKVWNKILLKGDGYLD